jgi:hypothetical protein
VKCEFETGWQRHLLNRIKNKGEEYGNICFLGGFRTTFFFVVFRKVKVDLQRFQHRNGAVAAAAAATCKSNVSGGGGDDFG